MSHNAYRTFTVDLAAAADRRELIAPGTEWGSLVITQLPAGVTALLSWGSQADTLRALGVGMTLEFDRCTPEGDGLYLTVPAGQGGTLELTVFYARGARVQP